MSLDTDFVAEAAQVGMAPVELLLSTITLARALWPGWKIKVELPTALIPLQHNRTVSIYQIIIVFGVWAVPSPKLKEMSSLFIYLF